MCPVLGYLWRFTGVGDEGSGLKLLACASAVVFAASAGHLAHRRLCGFEGGYGRWRGRRYAMAGGPRRVCVEALAGLQTVLVRALERLRGGLERMRALERVLQTVLVRALE